MPGIELTFPVGKLHATPWGRHVNEGAVEWPPSPWRLLRALVATWHLKAKDDISEQTMRDLVRALAEKLPNYQLPKAGLGHTRHYMPVIEGKNQKTTKIFDAFIHLQESACVHWDVLLSAEQNRALALLSDRLGYLGRAESLVEAKALLFDSAFESNAVPLPDTEPVPMGKELTRVLAAQTPTAYESWRAAQIPPTNDSKAKGKKAKTIVALPVDLFDALHADTGDLQAAGWSLPPGSRMIDYARPDDCFDLAASTTKRNTNVRPTVARFVLTSAILPRMTRAISVADRVHQALVSYSAQAPIFTGKENGEILTGHRHAHIFCEAQGERDSISHVTIFAEQGFDVPARNALEKLQRVWGHGGHDLQLVLLGFGNTQTFMDADLFASAKVWRSLTPFVSTRHPKTYNDGRPKLDADGWPIGSAAHDLRRLLAEGGKPPPSKIESLAHVLVNGRTVRPLEFQIERKNGGGLRANQPPTCFKVTFSEPVRGPLAFGYGAHFGLGLFVPVSDHNPQ
jgi:CRISPR-associated protein Csb2